MNAKRYLYRDSYVSTYVKVDDDYIDIVQSEPASDVLLRVKSRARDQALGVFAAKLQQAHRATVRPTEPLNQSPMLKETEQSRSNNQIASLVFAAFGSFNEDPFFEISRLLKDQEVELSISTWGND